MMKATNRPDRRAVSLRTRVAAGLFAASTCLTPLVAFAQGPPIGRYFPLDQTTAPGVAGQWSTAARRGAPRTLQLVRVELPDGEGQVGFYVHPDGGLRNAGAPGLAAIQVGCVYRLKISDMPAFPGGELYPTVELLDRLHPPRGREHEFPIPITFTEQEIRYALQGRLVTKVVYLEQPDRAAPERNSTAARTRIAAPAENVLAAADEAGRPMAIVRIGARVPDPVSPEPGFFGTGAPILFPTESAARAGGGQP